MHPPHPCLAVAGATCRSAASIRVYSPGRGRERVNLGTHLTSEDGDVGAHGIEQCRGNAFALLKK